MGQQHRVRPRRTTVGSGIAGPPRAGAQPRHHSSSPARIDSLVDFLDDHPEAGVVAPRWSTPTAPTSTPPARSPRRRRRLFGRRSPLTRWFPRNRWSTAFLSGRDHRRTRPFQVDWVSGAAMAVPRVAVDATGRLRRGVLPLLGGRRLVPPDQGRRLEVWCEPAARVVHDEGGTRDHGWSPRSSATSTPAPTSTGATTTPPSRGTRCGGCRRCARLRAAVLVLVARIRPDRAPAVPPTPRPGTDRFRPKQVIRDPIHLSVLASGPSPSSGG